MSSGAEKQSLPWSQIIVLSSIPLIMVLGNSMLIPVLQDMQKALHVSKFQTSLVISLFSVPAGIIIPLSGFLSDRFGRKKIIIPSLFLYGIGGLIAGFAAGFLKHPYFMIMVGRVIQGLGAAGTAPITMALIGDLFKGSSRSKILGINEASNGFGKVLSPIIGSLLGFIVWYAAFFAFPVFCVAAALALWFLVKEPDQKREPLPFGTYVKNVKEILKREGRWLFSAYACGVIALFTLFGVLFFLSEVLESQYHIDGILKGLILAIPLGAMCTTSYITGAVIKKNVVLMKWLIATGLFLLGGSLVCNAFFSNTYIRIGLLAISGIGTGLALPCLNMLITSAVSSQERGIVTSLYGSVRFLGVAFGPPIFSWLMDLSTALMFISVAALAAAGGLLCMIFIHPEKSQSEKKQQADAFSHLKERRVWTFRNKIR
ncbi:MFS transporter [Fodinisporobacter ferrooxydans]|uniref:MFS transporter n=1 Tax=Fodinisporobacter ferrooxydans TaxID=2901836 RepID=A0ABY4CQ96_9BACL|nr:MFS transporter [Alicyclobacillaceae bacterium MYW30-H2]